MPREEFEIVAKVFEEIAVAAQRYSGNMRRAIDYGLFQKRLMDRALNAVPDYSPEEWRGLKEFVTDDFERVGNFKEVMTIDEMVRFLHAMSAAMHWEGSFKRISESDNVVVLELEERVGFGTDQHAVNSVSIFEFDGTGRIRHLDIYLQATAGTVEKGEAYE